MAVIDKVPRFDQHDTGRLTLRVGRGDGRRKTEEGRGKREEGRGKREEGRGKREEGRGKREEGRGKREEGRQHPVIPESRSDIRD
ncbi:MAG: hypothetical protein ACXIUB_01455, partial [Wenzhouxiangella sp.]